MYAGCLPMARRSVVSGRRSFEGLPASPRPVAPRPVRCSLRLPCPLQALWPASWAFPALQLPAMPPSITPAAATLRRSAAATAGVKVRLPLEPTPLAAPRMRRAAGLAAACPWGLVWHLLTAERQPTCSLPRILGMLRQLSAATPPAGELDGEMSEVQSLHSTMFGMQSVGQVGCHWAEPRSSLNG